MSSTINVKCSNCGFSFSFPESELVSGMSIKDKNGNIVQERPPVKAEGFIFVKCEKCNYPTRCSNAKISN